MLESSTTMGDEDLLPDPHPGEILAVGRASSKADQSGLPSEPF